MNENRYSNLDNEAYRVAYLIAGYIRNTLTEQEHKELADWVDASDQNMQLFEDLTDENNIAANLELMDKVQSEQSFMHLQESGAFKKPAKKFMLNKVWIAAASIIIIIAGAFLIYRYSDTKTVRNNELSISDSTTLKPGGNRATLTISDGTVIDLATAKNGSIQDGEGSHVSKLGDGELVYEKSDSSKGLLAMHTLSTPVGGQYQLRLPDGTKVWLNAASILQYPTQFSGNERRIQLDGEAYFEVAKNVKQPFKVVLKDSSTVTVLGTHFNVMSYQSEEAKEITLIEGSVAVNSVKNSEILKPGMQASINQQRTVTKSGVDTEEITGWKNGLFVFHDAPIESIMRQIERWYDAKIVYEGEIKQQFNATILRSEPLAKLLHLLELNGYVHFKTENKTIYVLP